MAMLARLAAPAKGTAAYERLLRSVERTKSNRVFRKLLKERWERDRGLVTAQNDNGTGLEGDVFLRELQMDYCGRMVDHGIGALPSSFNVCEAFFKFIPQSGLFELRPELDHTFSWPYFMDAMTDGSLDATAQNAAEQMEDGVIYSFNNDDDPTEVTFNVAHGRQFAIGSFCIVRHESELTVAAVGGLQYDIATLESELKSDVTFGPFTPGRENITPDPRLERRVVEMTRAPGFWKTIGVTRWDIGTGRRHVRYVLQDWGDSFLITTDDPNVFVLENGTFAKGVDEETLKRITERTEEFQQIFELCSSATYLPLHFSRHEASIAVERVKTTYGREVSKLSYKKVVRRAPAHVRLAYRTVAVLPHRRLSTYPRATTHITPALEIETTGFWKQLEPDAVGEDRNGAPTVGRTWVTKHLSWIEVNQSTVAVGRSGLGVAPPDGPDPGWIYVMRSAAHQPGVFKIGLTRRTPEERSRELSANTATPDKLLVVHEWQTRDCGEAEAQIHAELAPHRMNPRREFFSAPLRRIVEVITSVLEVVDSV